MKLHPSRSDDYLFANHSIYNTYRLIWLRYVPRWVDIVMRWLVWLLIVSGIIYAVLHSDFQ